MKKLISIVLVLLMVSSLVACQGSGSETKGTEKTKISFALWDEVQKPIFEEIIEKFEAENTDINVEIQLTPWSQYWTKLDAAMGSNNAADVFWMNIFLPKYADAGVVEPLTEYIEKDNVDMDNYHMHVTDALYYDGVQYCLPKGIDTVQVFYNKAIFEKYGVAQPKEGWTWEDMREIAKQLKEKIDAAGSDEYPILMELESQPSYFNFIIQSGGYIISDDKKTAGFDQPGTIKAYQDMVDLMNSGLMPGSEVLSDTKGTDLFLTQKGAMLFMGSWKIPVLDESSFAEQIGVVTMPAKEKGNQSAIGGLGYAINSNSKEKDAAWRLVKYLAGEESNKLQAEAKVDVPALISAQQYYKTEHIDSDVIFEALKTGFAFPTSLGVADWYTTVSDVSGQIFAQEVTAEEGCQQIQESMQSVLDSKSN
ncbi:MAG: ABC transporter substrate-binding protein [Lachnospiraceae bacterium]